MSRLKSVTAKESLSEHDIQSAFVRALRDHPDPALLTSFAIPNAGKRSFAVAAMLKAEGFRTGMPDWCLPVARGGYNALWIEFKRPKMKPTPEQMEIHDRLKKNGGLVTVHTDTNAAISEVLTYLSM